MLYRVLGMVVWRFAKRFARRKAARAQAPKKGLAALVLVLAIAALLYERRS